MRRVLEVSEFIAVWGLYALVRVLPMGIVERATWLLGEVAFLVLRERRRIALENVRQALRDLSASRIRAIARGSFRSFLLTAMPEITKLRPHLS